MKKILFSIAIFVCAVMQASAQNKQYTASMQKAIESFNTAKSADDMVTASNTFGRIAAAEPKEWLPNYYAAYAQLMAGFMTSESDMAKAQAYMDKAQEFISNSAKLAVQPAQLSEIGVMQAYIYIGKIIEDPMSKGQSLSPKVFQELGKAAGMNPANPRALFLQGMFTLQMPEFYGGGAKNARPFLEKAVVLFDAEAKDDLLPRWGKEENAGMLASIVAKEEK